MKTLLLFLLAAFAMAPSAQALEWDQVPTVDLRNREKEIDTLPLLLESHEGARCAPSRINVPGMTALLVDLDGDGQLEMVKSGKDYLTRSRLSADGQIMVRDQVNFPWKFVEEDSVSFCVAGPYDLDGDGRLELVAWGTVPDFKEWSFWVIDAQKFVITSQFTLANQPERRPDERWDGTYAVVGTLPGLLADPDQLALVLCVTIGHDAYGRGLMAVDPSSGEILWHFQCGPKVVSSNVAIQDIDGDGSVEVLFVGTSPGNLHGELVGDYSDDETRLFALNSHGAEIWSRRLEDQMSFGRMLIGNLDGDSGLEIVTFSATSGQPRGTLSVWSGSGEHKTSLTIPEVPSYCTLIPNPARDHDDILIATVPGTVAKIEYRPQGLIPTRKVEFGSCSSFGLVFPCAATGQTALIVNHGIGLVSLLDEDLDLLAAATTIRSGLVDVFLPWRNGETQVLVRVGTGLTGHTILRNPNALPTQPVLRFLASVPPLGWALVLLVVLSLAGWGVLALRHRREIIARAVIPGDGDHLREARLHLLEDLELSGHGAIAPLRSLRRMLWLLDALKTGIDFNEEMDARFREIWADCHQEDLPRLLVILDRARAAQLPLAFIDSATGALQKIQTLLTGLGKSNFGLDQLLNAGEQLHLHCDVTENSLQSLRKEVGGLFTTDLQQVIQRVLRANEAEINNSHIKVEVGRMAEAAGGESPGSAETDQEGLHCRIDPTELGFVLDNLVGNAVRSMSGAEKRQLRLTWLATNGLVKLEISDTGVGIATEDRDLILETPFTTKERGGLGLPKSQRILRKYGGQLSIKSSAPGRGTTFQLLLPRANH